MPVFIGLISILGALMVSVSFNAEKVAFHGLVGKNGEVFKCEAVKPEHRESIVAHIKAMQSNNSLNGQEHMYETGNVYSYEFFNKNGGGQVFTLTAKECTEGLERIINRTRPDHING